MQITNRRVWPFARVFLNPVLGLLIWQAGCGSRDRPAAAEEPAEVYTVVIDRQDSGAAASEEPLVGEMRPPAVLAFEMVGVSPRLPADADQEHQAWAQQAAIIDAFVKAVIESRRSQGLSTSNFTEQIGPRLALKHASTNEGETVEVRIIARGIEHVFALRGGRLENAPRDFALVQRLFIESGGQFTLLSGDAAPTSGRYVARVGCYVPAPSDSALAGDTSPAQEASPQTPR